LEEDGQN